MEAEASPESGNCEAPKNASHKFRCQAAFPPRRSWGRLIWAVAADLALDTVGGLVLDSWWM